MQGIHGRERENRKSKQKKRKTHLTHTGLLMEGLEHLRERILRFKIAVDSLHHAI